MGGEMKYQMNDIDQVVLDIYHSENSPLHRYASFDYCYGYFQIKSHQELSHDIEKACLQLGFYLASWGMLRGSSFLLQKSIKYYEPLIKYLITLKKEEHEIWHIDIDVYNNKNIDTILKVYGDIQNLIIKNNGNNRHIVLVTKIMLGVFGCIPAFDQYFSDTFREIFKNKYRCGFRSVDKKSLLCLKEFYDDNKASIDKLSINIIDFETGNSKSLLYKKSKIIDMYGFAKGIKL